MARRHPGSGASGHVSSGALSAEAGQSRGDAQEPIGWRIRRLLAAHDVLPRIIAFITDDYGPGALSDAWDEFRCCDTEHDRGTILEFTAESAFLEQFISWFAYTWTPMMLSERAEEVELWEQIPAAQMFLAYHPELDPLLARYLDACTDTPFSFFEILSSEPGESFTCWDLICGGRQLVVESAVSEDLQECQILYARIIEVDGIPVMDAAAPWPLPAEDLRPAILALRKVILERPGDVESADARQRLLANDSDVRRFYWGLVEQALLDESVPRQFYPGNSQH